MWHSTTLLKKYQPELSQWLSSQPKGIHTFFSQINNAVFNCFLLLLEQMPWPQKKKRQITPLDEEDQEYEQEEYDGQEKKESSEEDEGGEGDDEEEEEIRIHKPEGH